MMAKNSDRGCKKNSVHPLCDVRAVHPGAVDSAAVRYDASKMIHGDGIMDLNCAQTLVSAQIATDCDGSMGATHWSG